MARGWFARVSAPLMWVFGTILFVSHVQTLNQFSKLQSANDDLRARLQKQEDHTSDHKESINVVSSRLALQEEHAVKHAADVSAVKDTLAQALEPEGDAPPRQLLTTMVVGTTATSGCHEVPDSDKTFTLSSAACVSANVRCPQCFVAVTLSGARTGTFAGCSTARIGSAAISGTQVIEYIFINTHATNTYTIKDGATNYNQYVLGPLQQVHATCYTGGSDQLYFESNYGGDIYDGTARRTVCPSGCDTARPRRTDTLGQFSVYLAPSQLTCSSSAHAASAGTVSIDAIEQIDACTDSLATCTTTPVVGDGTTFQYALPGGTVSNICTGR